MLAIVVGDFTENVNFKIDLEGRGVGEGPSRIMLEPSQGWTYSEDFKETITQDQISPVFLKSLLFLAWHSECRKGTVGASWTRIRL